MSPVWQLALIGFSPFERSALESCLRLATDPQRRYAVVGDMERADLLIADTDTASVRETLRLAKRLDTTLAIGAHAVDGCMAQLPRPLNPLLAVRTLGGMLVGRTPPMRAQAALAATAQARTVAAPDAARAARSARQCSILVVDPSKQVLRFMATHLVRFGFEVRLAASGEEALKMLTEHAFEFVFVERTLPSLDGWQVCKLVKQAPRRGTQRPPKVVLVAGIDSRVDRMRAALAGCDGYLCKPLTHDALMAVVGEHVVANADSAQTVYAPLMAV